MVETTRLIFVWERCDACYEANQIRKPSKDKLRCEVCTASWSDRTMRMLAEKRASHCRQRTGAWRAARYWVRRRRGSVVSG